MSNLDAPSREPKDWSADMAAVALHRDRDCFLRIYDHFMPRVCQYLRGMGAPDAVAEELAQEAMLRLWQHAAGYDPARSAVSTWLFRIARNLHIDRIRREPATHQGLGQEVEFDVELQPDPASAEDYAESVHLKRRIDALSSVQARLIRMSYFEAKTHQEPTPTNDRLDPRRNPHGITQALRGHRRRLPGRPRRGASRRTLAR